MKSGARWHVRGIRPQARETAREAARRSGMSVSQWLDSVITDAAMETGVAVPPPSPQPPRSSELPRESTERSVASAQPPRRVEAFNPPPFANGDFIPGTAPHDHVAPRHSEPAHLPSHAASEPPGEKAQSPADDRLVARLFTEEGLAEVTERLDSLARTLADDSGLADVRSRLDTLAGQLAQDDGLSEVKERLDSLTEKLAQDDGIDAVRERLDSLTQKLAHDDGLNEINTRLDNLTGQLETMARANAANAQAQQASRQADTTEQVTEVISKLDRRLDELVADNCSARSEIEERLRAVNRSIADLGVETLRPRLPSTAKTPLDQALIEIADRQRALDSTPDLTSVDSPAIAPADALPRAQTQELAGLEQQLRQINEQIGTLNRPCGLDKAVELLRDDLAEIGVMLQDAMPRRAVEALEAEMRKLSERIDQTRDAGVAGVSLTAIERGLAEVRDALHMLTPAENLSGLGETVKVLGEKVDLIAGNTQDPAALKQLEGAIVAMRGIVTHVASNDALANLTAEVRALSAKVDQMTGPAGDSDVLATLEQRIAKLADALEARNRSGHDVPNELETVLAGLTEKIEHIQTTRGDEMALGHLEDRIANLMQKLDASDQRLNHLEGIERGLAELVLHLEQQRLPALTRSSSSEAAPDVNSLVRDVNGLKQMERQTQDSLEAVHGALENVVDRLATIESDIRDRINEAVSAVVAPKLAPSMAETAAVATVAAAAPAVAPAAVALAPAARPSAEAAAPELRPSEPKSERRDAAPAAPMTAGTKLAAKVQTPPPADVSPAASGLAPSVSEPGAIGTTPLRASTPAASERRPIDPNLPPDHPLEPGVSRGRYPATPADRIAASEAALGSAKPPVIPDPGGKSNFIAAARRAAQAASSEAAVRSSPRATETAGPKAAVTPTMFPSLLRKHARSLIIAASVLAIVLGSINIVRNWLADEPKAGANGETVTPPTHGAAPATGDKSSQAAKEPAQAPAASAPERQSSLAPAPGFPPPSGFLMPAPNPLAADTTGTIMPPEAAPQPTPRPAAATATTKPAAPLQAATPAGGAELPAGIGGALRTAAAKGDPAAQYEIAQRFADGRGLPQNLNAAADWFERAANQGLAPAQFRLGGLYEKGLGVKKDLEAARRFYTLAGEAGNAKALHNLAVLYAEGMDGKPDYQAAAHWFRKAAAFGMADSQYNLGVLYARGIGVEQNLAEAYRWFGLAARSGDKESERKRDELTSRLDPRSLQGATRAIEEFKPESQPEAANQVKAPAGGWDPVSAPAVTPAGKRRTSAPQSVRQEAAAKLDF